MAASHSSTTGMGGAATTALRRRHHHPATVAANNDNNYDDKTQHFRSKDHKTAGAANAAIADNNQGGFRHDQPALMLLLPSLCSIYLYQFGPTFSISSSSNGGVNLFPTPHLILSITLLLLYTLDLSCILMKIHNGLSMNHTAFTDFFLFVTYGGVVFMNGMTVFICSLLSEDPINSVSASSNDTTTTTTTTSGFLGCLIGGTNVLVLAQLGMWIHLQCRWMYPFINNNNNKHNQQQKHNKQKMAQPATPEELEELDSIQLMQKFATGVERMLFLTLPLTFSAMMMYTLSTILSSVPSNGYDLEDAYHPHHSHYIHHYHHHDSNGGGNGGVRFWEDLGRNEPHMTTEHVALLMPYLLAVSLMGSMQMVSNLVSSIDEQKKTTPRNDERHDHQSFEKNDDVLTPRDTRLHNLLLLLLPPFMHIVIHYPTKLLQSHYGLVDLSLICLFSYTLLYYTLLLRSNRRRRQHRHPNNRRWHHNTSTNYQTYSQILTDTRMLLCLLLLAYLLTMRYFTPWLRYTQATTMNFSEVTSPPTIDNNNTNSNIAVGEVDPTPPPHWHTTAWFTLSYSCLVLSYLFFQSQREEGSYRSEHDSLISTTPTPHFLVTYLNQKHCFGTQLSNEYNSDISQVCLILTCVCVGRALRSGWMYTTVLTLPWMCLCLWLESFMVSTSKRVCVYVCVYVFFCMLCVLCCVMCV